MTARLTNPANVKNWREVWYGLQSWRHRRAHQLHIEPLCRECKKAGRITPATIADHVEPHGGDSTKFVLGELQSLCEACHNPKWASDKRGYVDTIGDDGVPIDARHPFNRVRL